MIPGAREAAAGCVYIHEPAESGDMDVRPLRLHWGQHSPLPSQQVGRRRR